MRLGKRRSFLFAASFALLLALAIFLPARETAAANPTFTLLNDLPTNMVVGETYTIHIGVVSDEPFIWARALGDDYYPGRGAVIHGGDMVHSGTSGELSLTVIARGSTAGFPGGCDPMAVVVGARYQGGEIHSERFDFCVTIP
jgi:hypothetical protein